MKSRQDNDSTLKSAKFALFCSVVKYSTVHLHFSNLAKIWKSGQWLQFQSELHLLEGWISPRAEIQYSSSECLWEQDTFTFFTSQNPGTQNNKNPSKGLVPVVIPRVTEVTRANQTSVVAVRS